MKPHTREVTPDDVAEFLSALADTKPSVPPSLEREHVLAAAKAVASTPRKPSRSARAARRRPLIPRRIPSVSLSALTALFAGLPAKAAAASVVAVATAGGLVATDNVPDELLTGLERATQEAGFEVPAQGPPPFAGPGANEERAAVGTDGVDGPDRAELNANAKDKEEALDHAEEASVNAGENNDFGFERARAGADNAGGVADEARSRDTGADASTQSSTRRQQARERETQAREQSTTTEQEARSNAATQGADASTDGAEQEDDARAGAGATADDARSNASGRP